MCFEVVYCVGYDEFVCVGVFLCGVKVGVDCVW